MKFIAPAILAAALLCYNLMAAELQFENAVPLGTINESALNEASGIAVSVLNPGVFWTHNDGSRNIIYAFKMDGSLLAGFNLGKNPDDVEDIAVGPGPKAGAQYLYVGDIGSNSASRSSLRIYRIEEPPVNLAWASDPVSPNFQGVDVCRVMYPDGLVFDSEGIMIDPIDKMLYVVTKESSQAQLFRVPLSALADGATANLQFAGFAPMRKVSGAAISADGKLVALRREELAFAWERDPGTSVADALQNFGASIPVVGPPLEPNGEAISFLPDGTGYVTLSEGDSQPVNFFKRICSDPPQFTGAPIPEQNGLRLNFLGCQGSKIIVERSTNFSTWDELGTVTIGSGGATFLDLDGTGTRFYRLRVTTP